MLHVTPLSDKLKEDFTKLFRDYYAELDCGEDSEHLVGEYILPDLLSGLLSIDIIEDGGAPAGFIIYQVDDINNDWNVREGWGDIREIYIVPEKRGQGLGKFLLYTAEMKLLERGVEKAYCLPSFDSEKFFASCGYSATDEYCEDLDTLLWQKLDLNNKCK